MSRRSLFTISVLMFLGLFVFSCGKDRITGTGAVVSESRNVENFYGVSVSAGSQISVSNGNTYSVTVKGFENIIPSIRTYVENGILIISYANNTSVSNDNSEIDITMPTLLSISSQTQNNINVTGNFIGMNNLTVTTTGNGNITVSNAKTTDLALNISGNGKISSFGLSAKNATVKINGNGDAEVTASQKLKVNITGSGNVYYKGSPAIDSTISGTGHVIKQ